GSVPIAVCALLAGVLMVFNMVTGRGDAAAVVVPLLMAIVAALAAAIFVAVILVTARREDLDTVPEAEAASPDPA
ncbi:MAG: hypothetical protein AAF514_17695, partial [Verrucomicrobiota bacterium]